MPLNYFFVVDGTVSIEPTTGALIDVHSQQEGVAVQPDLSGVATLQPLLDKYADIPSVKALSDGLAAMAARPPQLAQTFQYTQTPASSFSTADKARDQAHVMTIVTWWVPEQWPGSAWCCWVSACSACSAGGSSPLCSAEPGPARQAPPRSRPEPVMRNGPTRTEPLALGRSDEHRQDREHGWNERDDPGKGSS